MKTVHYSKIEKFSRRLEEEESNKGNIYMCPNACVRVNFEKATDFEFKCPECGVILNHQDNEKTIGFLKSKIKDLRMSNGFSKMTNGATKVENSRAVMGRYTKISNDHKKKILVA